MSDLAETLNTAVEHHQAGRLDMAEQLYREILRQNPQLPDAWHLLGALAMQTGHHDQAVECMSRAIQIRPEQALYHGNLGCVYENMGRLAEAESCLRRALSLFPDDYSSLYNLGNVLKAQGRWNEAMASYAQAICLRPNFAEACNNLGTLLLRESRHAEAAQWLRRAVELRPDFAEAHSNLGLVLYRMEQHREAVACFERAIQLQPNFAHAYRNLASTLQDRMQLLEAIAYYQRAVALCPADASIESSLLHCRQYEPGITRARLAAGHAAWDQRHAAPLESQWGAWQVQRAAERPLRLGFVSPDFGQHPVGWFLIGVWESIDRTECHLTAYSDRVLGDALTTRFQAACDAWRDTAPMDDEALARQIRDDRIDILFDLSGHTARNRLLVFARKPAPIQITWLGYAGTTGMKAMDHLIADRWEIAPGEEADYRETVFRMTDGYVCYTPPCDAPQVGPLPAIRRGYVTYGSLSNPAKINLGVVGLWAEILRRKPSARLVLQYRGFDLPETQQRCRDGFAAAGVDPRRIDMHGGAQHPGFLDRYREIDIALDPFPYSGGVTTCEALWMGVPVIAWPGETFAGRHSLSHLSNAGVLETIADSPEQYVELALHWASDVSRLAEWRRTFRDRMARSPLCDCRRFSGQFLEQLRNLWRSWCGKDHG